MDDTVDRRPARANRAGPVFHELLDELRDLEGRLLSHPNGLDDEQFTVETYKWILSITQVALDCYVWADRDNPRFVDIVGPYKKWGGDNADAFYQWIPLDPNRTYQVSGRKGDAVARPKPMQVAIDPDVGLTLEDEDELLLQAVRVRPRTAAAGGDDLQVDAQPGQTQSLAEAGGLGTKIVFAHGLFDLRVMAHEIRTSGHGS
jgi:hypothetical protein